LVPGTSLDSAIPVVRDLAAALLMRKGFGRLLFQYGLLSPPEFYATNSRSVIASMNQMRYEIEFQLALPETIEDIDLARIEDLQFENTFRTGSKTRDFTTPGRILRELMPKLS
jgi:hypothetical protein